MQYEQRRLLAPHSTIPHSRHPTKCSTNNKSYSPHIRPYHTATTPQNAVRTTKAARPTFGHITQRPPHKMQYEQQKLLAPHSTISHSDHPTKCSTDNEGYSLRIRPYHTAATPQNAVRTTKVTRPTFDHITQRPPHKMQYEQRRLLATHSTISHSRHPTKCSTNNKSCSLRIRPYHTAATPQNAVRTTKVTRSAFVHTTRRTSHGIRRRQLRRAFSPRRLRG